MEIDMTPYENQDFDEDQLGEILAGLGKGLDVTIYAKPEFESHQMYEISYGLEKNLDISLYAKPEFDYDQMREIRWGLEEGLDVSLYARPEFNGWQMDEIRIGLKNNIDVSIYAKPKFDQWQMREIKSGLEKKIDVSLYAKPEFFWQQMHEIKNGLVAGLDASKYAFVHYSADKMNQARLDLIEEKMKEYEKNFPIVESSNYSWEKDNENKLQEIRLGLQNGIDVSKYDRFSDSNIMREIRLGLEDNLNMSICYAYNDIQLSDVKNIRESLSKDIYTTMNVISHTEPFSEFDVATLTEIRLALKDGIDLKKFLRIKDFLRYTDYNDYTEYDTLPAFNADRLKEIRIGLKEGWLDEEFFDQLNDTQVIAYLQSHEIGLDEQQTKIVLDWFHDEDLFPDDDCFQSDTIYGISINNFDKTATSNLLSEKINNFDNLNNEQKKVLIDGFYEFCKIAQVSNSREESKSLACIYEPNIVLLTHAIIECASYNFSADVMKEVLLSARQGVNALELAKEGKSAKEIYENTVNQLHPTFNSTKADNYESQEPIAIYSIVTDTNVTMASFTSLEDAVLALGDKSINNYINRKNVFVNDVGYEIEKRYLYNNISIDFLNRLEYGAHENNYIYTAKEIRAVYEKLKDDVDRDEYYNQGYSDEQINKIIICKKEGFDSSLIENTAFTVEQMDILIRCLKEKIDISKFAYPEIKANQMSAIQQCIKSNMPVDAMIATLRNDILNFPQQSEIDVLDGTIGETPTKDIKKKDDPSL